jgi:hypothetical protein
MAAANPRPSRPKVLAWTCNASGIDPVRRGKAVQPCSWRQRAARACIIARARASAEGELVRQGTAQDNRPSAPRLCCEIAPSARSTRKGAFQLYRTLYRIVTGPVDRKAGPISRKVVWHPACAWARRRAVLVVPQMKMRAATTSPGNRLIIYGLVFAAIWPRSRDRGMLPVRAAGHGREQAEGPGTVAWFTCGLGPAAAAAKASSSRPVDRR